MIRFPTTFISRPAPLAVFLASIAVVATFVLFFAPWPEDPKVEETRALPGVETHVVTLERRMLTYRVDGEQKLQLTIQPWSEIPASELRHLIYRDEPPECGRSGCPTSYESFRNRTIPELKHAMAVAAPYQPNQELFPARDSRPTLRIEVANDVDWAWVERTALTVQYTGWSHSEMFIGGKSLGSVGFVYLSGCWPTPPVVFETHSSGLRANLLDRKANECVNDGEMTKTAILYDASDNPDTDCKALESPRMTALPPRLRSRVNQRSDQNGDGIIGPEEVTTGRLNATPGADHEAETDFWLYRMAVASQLGLLADVLEEVHHRRYDFDDVDRVLALVSTTGYTPRVGVEVPAGMPAGIAGPLIKQIAERAHVQTERPLYVVWAGEFSRDSVLHYDYAPRAFTEFPAKGLQTE